MLDRLKSEMYGSLEQSPNVELIRDLSLAQTRREISDTLIEWGFEADSESVEFILEQNQRRKAADEVKDYKQKNELLASTFQEVTPFEFYRDLFPVGSFERRGKQNDNKPNGIATILKTCPEEKNRNVIITDEWSELPELIQNSYVVISPVSYIGRNRTGKNARYAYGIAIDLDGVGMKQIKDLLHQMQNKILPWASYIVNSGHGLHLYYLFEDPVPMFQNVQEQLKRLKYALIDLVWNPYTSTRKTKEKQGLVQGYRIVGGASKLGEEYKVTAFRTRHAEESCKVTIEYLNEFVDPEDQVTEIKYKSNLTIADAKTLFPEWYERRIVKGERPGQWNIKRDLYDWWKRELMTGIKCGHRYHGVMVLAAYARKCGIDYAELEADAYGLLGAFDALSISEDNRFTMDDIKAALKAYSKPESIRLTKREITYKTGIQIKTNKRNGRKRAEHLKRARALQAVDYPAGEWRNAGGRPQGSGTDAPQIIKEWRTAHPEGRKADCIRDTGLSKPTIYKWWDN